MYVGEVKRLLTNGSEKENNWKSGFVAVDVYRIKQGDQNHDEI